MKHPALRVAAWQWIEPEYRRSIVDAILTMAVPTLPFKPVRVELVGSLVRGCGRLDSDLDLNLAALDWNEQVSWRRIWNDPRHRHAFMAALQPLSDSLKFKIEAAPNNPDQHTYDLTYDVLTDTYSNADRFPDLTARWWDGYQLKWLPRPFMAKNIEFATDPWAGQLEKWQQLYGSRYLTYQEVPQPHGSSTTQPAKLLADLPHPQTHW